MQTIEDYYLDLFQDVSATAEAQGIYKEDAFFDIVTEYLIESGEFDEVERSFYRPSQGGMRVDGYCGDPLVSQINQNANQATLGLIVLDFQQTADLRTLTSTEMEAHFRRLEKFIEQSRKPSFRDSLEPTDPGFGLADLISTRWSGLSRIKLYLITNKKLSGRVEGKEAGTIDERTVSYNVWDISRLYSLFSSGRDRETLTINFRDLPGGSLRALHASTPENPNQVYLAAIPALDLAQIYDRWGSRLLEQNVRVFLQARSNVNKGIKHTLRHEPENFFSYNNGLTATAEAIVTDKEQNGLVITNLTNLQIVNGGQTTASIYAAYKANIDLTKVYVQMKLSIVKPEDTKELVPLISKFANSQNKVSNADFFANHPFHIRIEEFSKRIFSPSREGSFTLTKWFYERARGAYRDSQAYLTTAEKRRFNKEYPKAQTFTKTDLAKYLMVWTDQAYMVNRGAQKNFAAFAKQISSEWDRDDKQFNELFFKQLVAKKILFDLAVRVVQNQDWYETGGYRSQHAVLTLGMISSSVRSMGKSVDFLSIWNNQSASPAMEQALAKAANIAHEVLMHPGPGYKNITEWAKQPACWLNLRHMKVEWDEEWLHELITIEQEKQLTDSGKRDQKELNGIEAQAVVVQEGSNFWREVLNWCIREGEGSEKEHGILRYATRMPQTIPSAKQSIILVNLMSRLDGIGCPLKLKK